jgi:hypothetical protein
MCGCVMCGGTARRHAGTRDGDGDGRGNTQLHVRFMPFPFSPTAMAAAGFPQSRRTTDARGYHPGRNGFQLGCASPERNRSVLPTSNGARTNAYSIDLLPTSCGAKRVDEDCDTPSSINRYKACIEILGILFISQW